MGINWHYFFFNSYLSHVKWNLTLSSLLCLWRETSVWVILTHLVRSMFRSFFQGLACDVWGGWKKGATHFQAHICANKHYHPLRSCGGVPHNWQIHENIVEFSSLFLIRRWGLCYMNNYLTLCCWDCTCFPISMLVGLLVFFKG